MLVTNRVFSRIDLIEYMSYCNDMVSPQRTNSNKFDCFSYAW